MVEDIIFSKDWNLGIINTCSSRLVMHVDDCFKFKRYHTLERYNQRNFVLNTIWISNIISFDLKWCFVNELLVDDADKKSVSTAKG